MRSLEKSIIDSLSSHRNHSMVRRSNSCVVWMVLLVLYRTHATIQDDCWTPRFSSLSTARNGFVRCFWVHYSSLLSPFWRRTSKRRILSTRSMFNTSSRSCRRPTVRLNSQVESESVSWVLTIPNKKHPDDISVHSADQEITVMSDAQKRTKITP